MALPCIRSELLYRGLREFGHDVVGIVQPLLDLAALHQLVHREIPRLLAQQSVDVVVLRLGKGVHSRGDLILRHVGQQLLADLDRLVRVLHRPARAAQGAVLDVFGTPVRENRRSFRFRVQPGLLNSESAE